MSSDECRRASLGHARQMKIGKYLLERTIGKGNSAVVKLATHCDTHQKVAIKIIDKSRLEADAHRKLEREITVMKSLVHPYIIRLYEVMESKNLIYLVTEYADNGELLDLLLREKRLSEAQAKEKFRQLILAVEYIHSRNIVHRDLKAENLLLDAQGNIKVADFGFANTFKFNAKLQTFCGSPPYAAPELYQSLPYSPEKVDVWSLGVLLYVFVCGHLPFNGQNHIELREHVLAGQVHLPFFISTECGSLIRWMLTIDPEQRCTIDEIKRHPWVLLASTDASTNVSIPNEPLANAILDQAERLGYNRQQILESVHGNSYDSDAAIWHLLMEKFQKTCQIQQASAERPIAQTTESIVLDEPVQLVIDHGAESESLIDEDDELASEQIRAQYNRLHGLRRHTVARPDLPFVNGLPARLFARPSTTGKPNHRLSTRSGCTSSRTSHGRIIRGAPIASSTPHEVDDETDALARYLSRGKRHTVCEPDTILGGKVRRTSRESIKDRPLLSRRASDTSSSPINHSTRAHFERLFNHTLDTKPAEDDSNSAHRSLLQYAGLHIIREEQQRQNALPVSLISSETLSNLDDGAEKNNMDCDLHHHRLERKQQFIRSYYPVNRRHYSHAIAQRLAIPATMNSYFS